MLGLKYRVLSTKIIYCLVAIALSVNLVGCDRIGLPSGIGNFALRELSNVTLDIYNSVLNETASPQVIQKLSQDEAKYQPKIEILSPRSEATLDSTTLELKLAIENFPLFKDDRLGMGNHLHVILDNEPQGEIYSTNKPFVLRNLKPGTHTIRVLAQKPWHESFKNSGALAQVTFDILTATEGNQPNQDLPLLTYNQPRGSYSTEPILLDFYLSGVNQDDWQVLAKINDDSFLISEWQPIYLKGFKEGNNLIELELQDKDGTAIENAFNKTISLITFDPQNKENSTLKQLMSDRLSYKEAIAITQPNYSNESEPEELESSDTEIVLEEDNPLEEESPVKENSVKEILPETSKIVEEETTDLLDEIQETKAGSSADMQLSLEIEAAKETESKQIAVPVETKIQEPISEQEVKDSQEQEEVVDVVIEKIDLTTESEPANSAANSKKIAPKTDNISATAVNQTQSVAPTKTPSPLETITAIPAPKSALKLEETASEKTTEPFEAEASPDLDLPDLDSSKLDSLENSEELEPVPSDTSDAPQPRKLKVPQWWKNLVTQVQNIIAKIQNFTNV